jgi:hypothetical protein
LPGNAAPNASGAVAASASRRIAGTGRAGMRGADIRRKFDEIIAFSGIAEFVDTPVKRYSTGMSARLGFSIAAHLDPEVLIIDEVLAVGDLAFQARAFARIRELARRDIPVVVVSHDLGRVVSLCTDCLFLDHGTVVRHGNPVDCVAAYVSRQTAASTRSERCPVDLGSLRLDSRAPVRSGELARFTLTGRITAPEIDGLEPVGIRVLATDTGKTLFASSNTRCGTPFASRALRAGDRSADESATGYLSRRDSGLGPNARG